MRNITNDELQDILAKHKAWLDSDNSGARADLHNADLRNADLRDANLRDANLGYANLSYANLSYADLRDANLRDADLRDADLSDADLRDANLRDADLRYANLRDADLRYANLHNADLYSANLYNAKNAELILAQTQIVPESGWFIGWKKCHGDEIVKLRIPEDAKRSNAPGRKCRCDYAEVLEIWDGDEQVEQAFSRYKSEFIYRVGEIVKADSWDEDRFNECSHGIHFFLTRAEAEAY